jgi:hypothetical protein
MSSRQKVTTVRSLLIDIRAYRLGPRLVAIDERRYWHRQT